MSEEKKQKKSQVTAAEMVAMAVVLAILGTILKWLFVGLIWGLGWLSDRKWVRAAWSSKWVQAIRSRKWAQAVCMFVLIVAASSVGVFLAHVIHSTEEVVISTNTAAPATASTTAQGIPASSGLSLEGAVVATLDGKDYKYWLVKLKPQSAAQVFSLMANSPAKTTQHPSNNNPLFQNVRIVEESTDSGMLKKTSLVVGGNTLVTSSQDDNRLPYEMQSLSSLDIQPEILLISTWAGGNSCDSEKQVLLVKGADEYQATNAFGRCQVSWFDDKERAVTYFVYPANEYHPLAVMALAHTPKH